MPLSLSFGEALFDCFDGRRHIGGAPLNFAWNLRQFGFPVALVSAVGRDELGAEIRRFLEQASIGREWIVEREEPTGTVDVRLIHGEPDFTINENVAWDHIETAYRPDTSPVLLYFGTVAQRTARNRGTLRQLLDLNPQHIFFDINLRQRYYTEEIVLESLQRATIVKFNQSEWDVVRRVCRLEKPVHLLDAYALDTVALTRGAGEAELYTRQGAFRALPPSVTVVDTVGAGDAFSAALAAGVMAGAEAPLILNTACAAGAAVAAQPGAHVMLPHGVRRAFI